MLEVMVDLVAINGELPPFASPVQIPFPGSPLGIGPRIHYDASTETWRPLDEYNVVHLRTGFNLGRKQFATRDEARALLDACDPTFGGWSQIVPEQTDSAAWRACKYKFTAACRALGLE